MFCRSRTARPQVYAFLAAVFGFISGQNGAARFVPKNGNSCVREALFTVPHTHARTTDPFHVPCVCVCVYTLSLERVAVKFYWTAIYINIFIQRTPQLRDRFWAESPRKRERERERRAGSVLAYQSWGRQQIGPCRKAETIIETITTTKKKRQQQQHALVFRDLLLGAKLNPRGVYVCVCVCVERYRMYRFSLQ